MLAPKKKKSPAATHADEPFLLPAVSSKKKSPSKGRKKSSTNVSPSPIHEKKRSSIQHVQSHKVL